MTAINGVVSTIGHMDAVATDLPGAPDRESPAGSRAGSAAGSSAAGSSAGSAAGSPAGSRARTAPEPEPAPEPGRRERRLIETRRNIIDAARTLFESEGFTATTVEMIAERADVAPRTFFRYFPTKETLLFAEFDEVRRDMFDTLESRPRTEAPLRSLSVALCEMAAVIEARRDELVWGFRLCAAQQVEGVYERTMLKEQTNTRVAAFIADRLEVDDEVDPRPMAWAGAIMAVFAAAMKFSATDDPGVPVGRSVELLDELLEGTAAAMCAARPA